MSQINFIIVYFCFSFYALLTTHRWPQSTLEVGTYKETRVVKMSLVEPGDESGSPICKDEVNWAVCDHDHVGLMCQSNLSIQF